VTLQDCWVSIQAVLILVFNKINKILEDVIHLHLINRYLVLVLIQMVVTELALFKPNIIMLVNNRREMAILETSLKLGFQRKINLLRMLWKRTRTHLDTTQFQCQMSNRTSLSLKSIKTVNNSFNRNLWIRLRRSSHQCNNQ